MHTEKIETEASYFKYWGKAAKDGPTYHLLPYHCLDVAAVGWGLLDPDKPLCKNLANLLDCDSSQLRVFFSFCLALHDLGKFSRAFQGLQPNLSPDLISVRSQMNYTERHDTLGFSFWMDVFCKSIKNNASNIKWLSMIEPWIEIVTGHHGMPPKRSGCRVREFFESEDEEAVINFIDDALSLFLKEFDHQILFTTDFKKRLKKVSWQLAGIAVLSDWIGSNTEYFKYFKHAIKLETYWKEIALPSAQEAVKAIPKRPEISRLVELSKLFPFIDCPTPLQKYAVSEPLGNGPQLFILEDVTGAGKTEAALMLTHRLLNRGLADGLYVALPTMATANAMYERLGNVYRRFYHPESTPSLILAHGARDLSDLFRNSVFIPDRDSEEMNYSEKHDEKEDLSAGAYCNVWLADNRKKALLADVGVGTLDQALLAVLPVRHQSLRLLGLGRKVLLIDEVHAYDSYMQNLLNALLELHARQGGSTILLSATLSLNMRKDLIGAFYRGIDGTMPEISSTDFPLASHFDAADNTEKSIDTRDEVKRAISVIRLGTTDKVVEKIRLTLCSGQCVCWVRNTVKSAIRIYSDLLQNEWIDKDHLHLFHSRFAMVDRQRIEMDTVKRFGQESCQEDRKGHVLIATQVVEQSLDLDFDVLITDLAPVDLIIQRAGRLRRHVRDTLGNRVRSEAAKDQRGKPVLYIFAPDPVESPESNWLKNHQEGTQAVYPNIGRLWLTATRLIKDGHGEYSMPENARDLIEGVYSHEADCLIPPNLEKDSLDALGKDKSKKSMADLNVLKLNKGYTRLSGDWDEEIRVPTRLSEQETVSVALARSHKGCLSPYAETTRNEWAMSIVKIPESDWQKVKQKIKEPARKIIDNLKAEAKGLRWVEILPLIDETSGFYDPDYGWQIENGGGL